MLPTGNYALRVLAVAADSSRSEAVARFVVMPSECSIGDPASAPAALLLDGISELKLLSRSRILQDILQKPT